MRSLFIFAIESSICLTLFMAFYFLLLRKDTHHSTNRVFLLFSMLTSILLPLLNIDFSSVSEIFRGASTFAFTLPTVEINPDKGSPAIYNAFEILLMIYVTGLVISLIALLSSFGGIVLMIMFNSRTDNRIIRFSNNKPTCFSAFGYIFISTSISESEAEMMIRHEISHIKKNHFFDLVIAAFAGTVQWFNPAVYFLRRSLEAVHEYEADEVCISNGEEITLYQSLLISTALGTNIPIITNKFSNTSLLKKRIIMMTKKKSGSLASVKILFAIPLAALMFVAFSCKKSDQKKEPIVNQVTPQTEIKAAQEPEEIFTVCEQMPTFPGGEAEMFKQIYSNIEYPDIAKKNNIQGQVIVRFCITSEGNVEQVQIERGVDPSLNEAALNAIKKLPKFEPGRQDGKAVNVWFALPISFKLK